MTINNAATEVITAPSDAINAPRGKQPTDDQKLDGILKSGAAPTGMTNQPANASKWNEERQ
jgi:hypothetical protein